MIRIVPFKKHIATLALAVGLAAGAPLVSVAAVSPHASAHAAKTSSSTLSASTTDTTSSTDATADSSAPNSHAALHAKGAALLEAAKKSHGQPQTSEQRQKKCEAAKTGLVKKTTNLATNAQKIQDKIDSIFAKAQDYQKTNNVTADNYDTLVAAATSAQTKSAASVAALKDLTPTVDCSSGTVAQQVATFKAAAMQARDDLKSYRDAVKDVLKALETAKSTTTNPTEGSND